MLIMLAVSAVVAAVVAGWPGYQVGRASSDVDHAARHAAAEHRLAELAAERDRWRDRALDI